MSGWLYVLLMSRVLPTRLPQMKTAESSCIRGTKTISLWNSTGDVFALAMTPAPTRLLPFTGEDLSVTGKGENDCFMKNCFSSIILYFGGKGIRWLRHALWCVSEAWQEQMAYASWVIGGEIYKRMPGFPRSVKVSMPMKPFVNRKGIRRRSG